MRRGSITIAVLAIVGLGMVPAASTASERSDRAAQEVVPGSYIVVYKSSVGGVEGETKKREARHSFKAENRYTRAIKGFSAKLSRAEVAALKRDPEIQSVTQSRRVHLRATETLAGGEIVPTGVQRILAGTSHAASGSGGTASRASSAAVAVIDTGIDLEHPDLSTSPDGKNTFGSGGVDCASNSGPSPDDDNGHGTHVAGTIGAKNDGSAGSAVGVAPGTRLHAVKVLDSGGYGTDAEIICGIDWVTANASAHNIKVANMSLGWLGVAADNNPCGATTTPLHNAICSSTQAGVRYAVAAGNDGWPFPHSTAPDVPATYPQVVTATASSDSNGRGDGLGAAPTCRSGELDEKYASFSNFSNNSTGDHNRHTVAAPGVCIRSTWPLNLSPAGGYHTISGTSMASPHVAAAIARCIGEEGAATAGPCAALTDPGPIVSAVQSTRQSHGFCGAPNVQPVSGRYYGYETLAGPVPAEGFGVCMPASSLTVRRGKTATATVNVPRPAAYTNIVDLSTSGFPSGVTATFSHDRSRSTSGTMTVRATSTATRGTRTVTVLGTGLRSDGTSDGQRHGTTFTLTVR